jgi:hypothetical protein
MIIINKDGENNIFEDVQNIEEYSEILIWLDKNVKKINGNLKMIGGPGDIFMPSNAKLGDAILAFNLANENGAKNEKIIQKMKFCRFVNFHFWRRFNPIFGGSKWIAKIGKRIAPGQGGIHHSN